jgi:drug/metabolite transporter (DMT)-like permease
MAAMSHAAVPTRLDPAAVGAVGPTAGAVPSAAAGMLAGAAAMVFVGGSVAVSSLLSDAPLFTAQAVRYTVACLLLLGFARVLRRRVVAPRGAEWGWLLGVAVTGLVVFNIALVNGSRHAEPAVLGVAVACVPLVLAVVGPLLERRRPSPVVLIAALVVTCGAVLVQGVGRSDGIGLAWAVVVLCCEAGFTLLAVPVLVRHGPWGVSVHATWLAAVVFAAIGVVHEGPSAAVRLGLQDLLAVGYLAVAVTAVAFVLWYSSVGRLGAGRAGLLTGVAPVAAAATGVALGEPAPRPLVWLGIAVVAAGLALGLPASRTPGRRSPVRGPVQAPARRA